MENLPCRRKWLFVEWPSKYVMHIFIFEDDNSDWVNSTVSFWFSVLLCTLAHTIIVEYLVILQV